MQRDKEGPFKRQIKPGGFISAAIKAVSLVFAVIILAAMPSGCATEQSGAELTQINTYFSVLPVRTQKVRIRVEQTVKKINEDNAAPKSDDWLKKAYGSIQLKKLTDISSSD